MIGAIAIVFAAIMTLVAQLSGMEWQSHWLGDSWKEGWILLGLSATCYVVGWLERHVLSGDL